MLLLLHSRVASRHDWVQGCRDIMRILVFHLNIQATRPHACVCIFHILML